MIRESTPSFTFRTPYAAEIVTGGDITFTQRDRIIVQKEIGQEGAEAIDNGIKVSLTAEETLLFEPGIPARAQLWLILKGDKYAPSNEVEIEVRRILRRDCRP